ncbi:MAG TPA: outer membrane beta-barrel protein [Vicinamibacterales bacterium]|nr:outer membrane beta-barrel protein [Vicinamibacterales bacterium]
MLLPSVLALTLLTPSTALADVTAFLGVTATPASRVTRGFAGGIGLLVVGFEFEYADTVEDQAKDAPALKTYMINGLAQTPFPIAGMQLYATAGGGLYRRSVTQPSGVLSESNLAMNVGGGVKMSLVGPLRLRLDYRIINLRGESRHARVQRFYAGVNLKF